jgi:hypothetical protein
MAQPTVCPIVYELVVMRVKPDHVHDFMHHVAEGKKISEKYCKVLGLWVGDAGHFGTLFVLREWATLTARLDARDKLWNDAEAQKHYKETSPFISCIQTYLCKAPPSFTVKSPEAKSHIVIHKLKAKKFSVFGAHIYKDMIDLSATLTKEAVRPFAVLFPIVYDDHAMFTMWEIGSDKIEERYAKYVERIRDPQNWHRIANLQEYFEDEMSMLASPFDLSKCPTLHH